MKASSQPQLQNTSFCSNLRTHYMICKLYCERVWTPHSSSPVEVPDVLLRNDSAFRLQHLRSQLSQVVALTANQLLSRGLYVTYQTATGGALLRIATSTLRI